MTHDGWVPIRFQAMVYKCLRGLKRFVFYEVGIRMNGLP